MLGTSRACQEPLRPVRSLVPAPLWRLIGNIGMMGLQGFRIREPYQGPQSLLWMLSGADE